MKVYGRTSLHEFLDDFVVFRNLDPVDSRLPSLADVRNSVDIPPGKIPRKGQPIYAEVVVFLLKEAAKLIDPSYTIRQLVYVGDTRMNDGNAFTTITNAGGWSGIAFIAAENQLPPCVDLVEEGMTNLYLSNRWSALSDFETYCHDHDFHLGEGSAVIIDLDKTALGARGRNDHVINQARVEAVRLTVGNLLGDAFDLERFQGDYEILNQPTFHSFTTDNQDYLAYICLILGSDLFELDFLVECLDKGELETFEQFIINVNEQVEKLPPVLREVHNNVYKRVKAGDPTPFKTFRYHEYQTTISRMGCQDEGKTVPELLASEIVITQEVREAALRWKKERALLFGLSDKPDEASFPRDELILQGYQPIHCIETFAVGE